MAGVALSAIGVVFGWGIGTPTKPPTSWKEVEECISISEVTVTKDKIDVTPLKSKKKKYIGGHEDTGGELTTTFNKSNEFVTQWKEILTAYNSLTAEQVIWFCAYHPNLEEMDVYIVEPGEIPRSAYEVGSALQPAISNTLIDLPEPITAVKPTEPTSGE